ncbi:hypothetical protein LPJGGPFB_00404 [Ensifer adhaerens]|uniref:hypothetical protein n=1 Tax=Ensifer adhaerens TaxID=106592 RepID=UPI0031F386FB|nr:hypothetical protein [Ensifer adhaerens]
MTALSTRSFFSVVLTVASLGLATTGFAQTLREPAKGSSERAAILDALRPAVEAEMRGSVEFVVTTMRATPNWAFVQVEPQRPGGGAIDLSKTGFRDDADMMDGSTVFALVSFQGGRWNLVDHVVGPTDVAYAGWSERYGVPARLLGLE